MKTDIAPHSHARSKAAEHYNWLDWMKVIGITLIVYGHFSTFFDIYAYVFSVPLFFLMSGFLTKKETDSTVFWKKITYNLAIPLVIICTANYLINSIIGYVLYSNPPKNPLVFCIQLVLGIHRSLGAFWFVYTLILLKIVFQYTKKDYMHLIWTILSLAGAYIMNYHEIRIFGEDITSITWSVTEAFIAYPFFIIGNGFRIWKEKIAKYKANGYTLIWIALCLFVVFLCGNDHKYVYLYVCGYGDNILLCLIGGVVGSALVFFVSKMLERIRWNVITDISVGTLLILGFHGHLIFFIRHIFRTASFADALFSILIVLFFVPIIRLCISYAPLVMGKYRVKSSSTSDATVSHL